MAETAAAETVARLGLDGVAELDAHRTGDVMEARAA
jgi:hypothetical protein